VFYWIYDYPSSLVGMLFALVFSGGHLGRDLPASPLCAPLVPLRAACQRHGRVHTVQLLGALRRPGSAQHAQRSGIPAVLWWVVGIGVLISVLLVAMLDMEILVHVILGAALSMFLITFLITAMDNPFRGQVSVTPEAFKEPRMATTRGLEPSRSVREPSPWHLLHGVPQTLSAPALSKSP
jgi:hypothetical protein